MLWVFSFLIDYREEEETEVILFDAKGYIFIIMIILL